MRRPPTMYLLLLSVVLVLGIVSTLTFLGVPPFDSMRVFIFTNVVGFFTLLTLGVVGGAFVGMLLAHRILGNREFSPFERDVLRSLQEIRDRLDRLDGTPPSEEERLRR